MTRDKVFHGIVPVVGPAALSYKNRLIDILHRESINCHRPLSIFHCERNLQQMLQFQNNLTLLPSNYLFPSLSPLLISHSCQFSFRNSASSTQYSISSAHKLSVAQVSEEATIAIKSSVDAPPEEGPIELSPSIPPIFSTSDDPTRLQTATSVLLTGAIAVFLFRSLRRRAKRAKETVFILTVG
ncbi:uncharacterized protein LOC111390516 [Olea europaea var. sylvestris]|uniref:uncharacterized protein LOC111390516 n=1 Tax=Olea europaea var. sylvestris TaxID=158386 RepID=UPI000C1D6B86|nr:uncharacterized protein LOC111390516 [Olea europaea var. sylvestris]